ncbi:hypothetical protein RND71_038311 [Anisodus tanguticus]|uniref:Reverse transcriptase Ty1/copia-type domain-containing protein n=1 Tax=Anisodus tanguticus TaxID=243964 RepID=A0AAE1QZG2_9SOLA|nr:hypothetical protein RND71_038311 [Anisodus tanguticus]
MKWKIHQLDVKSAFLNEYIEEEVYVEQLFDFAVRNHENKVLKLKKALYGLKQAPLAWNSCIDKYFQDNGFTRCLHEYSLYIKVHTNEDILIVCLFVDELILTGSLFESFKKAMSLEFEMTDIGLMSYYLGQEVKRMEEGIFIFQESYTNEILMKFNMFDCNSVNTSMESKTKLSKFDDGEKVNPTFFKSLVVSLRYLTCTRPYIFFAVRVVSHFIEAPTSTHFKVTRRILRYLKGTIDLGLFYSSFNDFNLVGYCDSDYAEDIDDRKSKIDFVFFLGDCVISWSSKKQAIVHVSTREVEYVATISCTCHAIWLRRLLNQINLPQIEATTICVDNKSAQTLAKNPVYHDRSKHIDTRYHFLRKCIAKKDVELKYVMSHDQVTYIFTKPFKFEDFQRLRSILGMKKKN